MNEQLVPDDPDERQTYALRIVAQRCLYGVDKNPLATEMAKLSLWLLTLAKDKPFEFLDHAIRCGDSLVGINRLEQLASFNLKAGEEGVQIGRIELPFLEERVKQAITLRRQITEMQANTVEDVEAQDRMLREANEKIDRLKCAADMLISAEFVPGSAADKRSARDNAAIKVAVHFNDSDLPTFRREAQKALNGQVTFHWPLEFPEVVVERGGFDAFVGNPPFLGGMRISSEHGEKYEKALKSLYPNSRGTPDLCCYFFRRAFSLASNRTACVGLLATASIVEGDSRSVGIQSLIDDGGEIIRVRHAFAWPGQAGVVASMVILGRTRSEITKYIGEQQVDTITSHFDSTSYGTPLALKSNALVYTQGYTLYGSGFIIDALVRDSLLSSRTKNSEVIFPYLNSDLFNNAFDLSPVRWAINFGTRDEDIAKVYAEPFALVESLVKPERAKQTRQVHEHRFWLYWDKREKFFATVKDRERVLVCARVSKYLSFRFYPPTWVFSEQLKLFDLQSFSIFALLQSGIHDAWARQYSSTLGQTLRYSTSDGLDTFAFPKSAKALDQEGKRYYEARESILAEMKIGLTDCYNELNDPEQAAKPIRLLREFQTQMDNAVAAAYGWTDLNLDHGFHETKQGVRYTISKLARREVLARLLKLNHERYAEEVRQGLHEKKGKRGSGTVKREKGTVKRETKKAKAGDIGRTLFEDLAVNEDVWYFAYGSNLWMEQKENRTGSIRTGADRPRIARLADHRFAFNKRGSGEEIYANILSCPGEEVIGVVYRCSPSTMDTMNEWEGGYDRKNVTVVLEDGSSVEALTYIARRQNIVEDGQPSDRYLERILTGAAQHGLPQEYIEKIRLLAAACGENS